TRSPTVTWYVVSLTISGVRHDERTDARRTTLHWRNRDRQQKFEAGRVADPPAARRQSRRLPHPHWTATLPTSSARANSCRPRLTARPDALRASDATEYWSARQGSETPAAHGPSGPTPADGPWHGR